jgi:hypothetical protein
MKAQWKKKPLELAQQRPLTQQEQDAAKVIEAHAKMVRMNYEQYELRERLASLQRELGDTRNTAMRYAAKAHMYEVLRRRGVLVEDEGQFKFFSGDELDEFAQRYDAEMFFQSEEREVPARYFRDIWHQLQKLK